LFQQAAVQPNDINMISRGIGQRAANDNATSKINQYDSAMRNILKTMTIVVVMFFVCMTPTQTLWLLQNLGVITIDFSGWTYYTCQLALNCNSYVNPLIYALKYKDFRRGITQMLRTLAQHPFLGIKKTTTSSVVTASTADR
jgi:7 transmembrane receptor (rhodopsin family)